MRGEGWKLPAAVGVNSQQSAEGSPREKTDHNDYMYSCMHFPLLTGTTVGHDGAHNQALLCLHFSVLSFVLFVLYR